MSGRASLPSIVQITPSTKDITIPTTETSDTDIPTTKDTDTKSLQQQELENNLLLFKNELQISQLNVSFLSKLLPVTVDEFYTMFLNDSAPFSYSKYFHSEKMLVYYYLHGNL